MSAARPNTWMPLYVADYLADTGHLSARQHGAYLLLIMHYWRTGKPLPTSVQHLFNICRLSVDQWAEDGEKVMAFFALTPEGYTHKRIADEMAKSSRFIAQKAAAGIASASAKRQRKDNARSTGVDTSVASLVSTGDQRQVKTSPSPSQVEEGSVVSAGEEIVSRETSAPVVFLENRFVVSQSATDLIAAFDEERVRAFGSEQARLCPAADDGIQSQRWIDAGASVDLCRPIFMAAFTAKKRNGDQPIGSLRYFDRPVLSAIQESLRPAPKIITDDDLLATIPSFLKTEKTRKPNNFDSVLKGSYAALQNDKQTR